MLILKDEIYTYRNIESLFIMTLSSYLFFRIHYIGMCLLPYSWIVSPYVLLLHLIVMFSWNINDNKCIISQLEYSIFGITFMGNTNPSFIVPLKHRHILYINFIFGVIYYSLKIYEYACGAIVHL